MSPTVAILMTIACRREPFGKVSKLPVSTRRMLVHSASSVVAMPSGDRQEGTERLSPDQEP